MTLRLTEEQAETLNKVAEIDGVPVSEAVREAIEEHVTRRASDPEFRRRLKASMDRNKRILDRLAEE